VNLIFTFWFFHFYFCTSCVISFWLGVPFCSFSLSQSGVDHKTLIIVIVISIFVIVLGSHTYASILFIVVVIVVISTFQFNSQFTFAVLRAFFWPNLVLSIHYRAFISMGTLTTRYLQPIAPYIVKQKHDKSHCVVLIAVYGLQSLSPSRQKQSMAKLANLVMKFAGERKTVYCLQEKKLTQLVFRFSFRKRGKTKVKRN
jgi:hypothetical protein